MRYSIEPDAQAVKAGALASHLRICAFAGSYFWQNCCEQVKRAGEGAKTLRRYLQECVMEKLAPSSTCVQANTTGEQSGLM